MKSEFLSYIEDFNRPKKADATDLAYCVAEDYIKGKIAPELYLDCENDLEKLNYKRFCLALGIDEKYLREKTAIQLKEIFEEECIDLYGESFVKEPLGKAVILSSIFGYMNCGINADYYINHNSLAG
ncbi:MAG: hypothetical protein NC203_06170 [Firmicutes bacterium]|nr:hypothetical protein [[Eubacterium] siraeum]MCM1487934.1 hypothetical protein [Bacillota bacterium]